MNKKKCDLINEEIYEGKLPNGLRIIIMPRHGFSKQFAIYATNFGSNDIKFFPPEQNAQVEVPQGIAHFLEHKMFEQEGGENVFELFAKYGSQPNAFTDRDKTAYYFISTEEFYENLKILADYVNAPYFTEENVEKEKGIIAQEVQMYEDDPDSRLYNMLLQCLYSVHPTKNNIAGSVESVYEITKEQLYTCYNSFYNPGNMLLMLAGDINPEEAYNKACEIFSKDSRNLSSEVTKKAAYKEPASPYNKYSEVKMDVSRPKAFLGYKDKKIVPAGKALLERLAASELAMALFAGTTSRLYAELYDKQLADNSFGGDYMANEEYAFALFEIENEHFAEAEKIIKQHASRLDELKESDFERIKKAAIGNFITYFNNLERSTLMNLSLTMLGSDIFDYYEILTKVTFKDAIDFLNEILCEEQSALAVVLPCKI